MSLEQPVGGNGVSVSDQMGFGRLNGSENGVVARKKSCLTKLCSRGHWRPHEDAKLKELVAKHGPRNWNMIADNLRGRSGKSCRLRWFNQLDPRINRKCFSEDEEEKLLAAHRMYGNKWAQIARHFPGRTDNSIKNHWHVIMARKHREETCVYRKDRRRLLSNIFLQSSIPPRFPNFSNLNHHRRPVSTCTTSSTTAAAAAPAITLTPPWLIEEEEEEETGVMMVDERTNNNYSSEELSSSSSPSSVTHFYLNFKIENAKDNRNRNIPFIDFLGVGATI